jgi:hypothetical protein
VGWLSEPRASISTTSAKPPGQPCDPRSSVDAKVLRFFDEERFAIERPSHTNCPLCAAA